MRILWTLTSLLFPASAVALPAGQQDEQTAGGLPTELVDALDGIDDAVATVDLDLARGLLRETVETIDELDFDSVEDRMMGLLELDERGKRLGCLAEQLVLRESLVAACELIYEPRDTRLLSARNNLYATKVTLGDLDGSYAIIKELYEIWREEVEPGDPRLLTVMSNLALSKASLGDLRGALELEEAVLEAQLLRHSAEHPEVLSAKLSVACTLRDIGDVDAALEMLEDVHDICARTLPPGDAELMEIKAQLGEARSMVGDYGGARELQERVLDVREGRLPPGDPRVVNAKEALALTFSRQGDAERSRSMLEEVLDARREMYSDEHLPLLRAKNNLAVAMKLLGDYRGALALETEVLAEWVDAFPLNDPLVLSAKGNLAVTKMTLGDLQGARDLDEQVLEILERESPPGNPSLATARLNLAVVKKQLGELEGALVLEQRLLSGLEHLPPGHPRVLTAKHNLGLTKYLLHDFEAARDLLQEVYAIRQSLPREDAGRRRVTHNLAVAMCALGELESALPLVESTLEGLRVAARRLELESPRAAREGARLGLEDLAQALFLVRASDSSQRFAVPFLETLETLRLVSVATPRVALALDADPELRSHHARVAESRARLQVFIASPPSEPGAMEGWSAGIVQRARDRDRLERDLRNRLADLDLSSPDIEVARVAQSLDEGTVAISYLRYPHHHGMSLLSPDEKESIDSYLALVVHHDGHVDPIELGPAAPIDALVTSWRACIAESDATGAADDERKIGSELRARVLDKVLQSVDGEAPTAAFVVLDDALHLVPLEALPIEGGRVGDRLRVYSQVSVMRLVSAPPPAPTAGGLVALGGVDFDAIEQTPQSDRPAQPRIDARAETSRPPLRSVSDTSFGELLQTQYEVEDVGAQFERRFDREPLILRGKSATKSALVRYVGAARYLHLATHGWFAPEVFASQIDGLEGRRARAACEQAVDTVHGFAPMTLCGLALAGANLGPDAEGQVPGIVTAEELATLDLRNCDLAVLSACETNVGLRRAGQGILSLQTALHAAGARSAICSLWKVDDKATRRLMELFYAGLWTDGLGKSEALWKAKMTLRHEGRPVRDWAAWTLTGDPN